MARAYIVLARNDLDDSLLQVLDLKPNATPSKGLRVYEGVAQGGYQTFYLLDGVNAAVATVVGVAGGASLDTDGVTYGLSAYLLDHVEDTGGNESLTAAEAVAISGLIEVDVAAGTSINLTRINVHINAQAGVAGSDLDGTLGNSTGSVEEILRILQGERWRLPAASQVRTVAGLFDFTRLGDFVTAPVIEMDDSVRSTQTNARAIRGRGFQAPLTHLRAGEPRVAPIQTGLRDTKFQKVRVILDTGHLQLSATDGALAKLKAVTYSFLNPAFTYAGGITPAQTIGAANIPATGVGRAVVVYDVLGNVI